MKQQVSPAGSHSTRDLRLDVFRGLCLVMIFINHTPGTIYEYLTSRNFGFSDAAEGFVLMSGIAAGIAYAPAVGTALTWAGTGRIWARAWKLYQVHIVTVALCLLVVSAGLLWFGADWLLDDYGLGLVFSDPVKTQIGLVTMTHQFGYANILPLYATLLAAAPFMMRLGWGRPGLLLAISVAIWAAAGLWRSAGLLPELNFPNWPGEGGWFFNPLSWQLLFVVGLLIGMAMRQGRRFLPVRAGWMLAASAFLLFALIVQCWPGVSPWLNTHLVAAREAGVPYLLLAFDKTYLTGPRLLHVLALAYVISALPAIRRFCGSALAQSFALLGRHSLEVFALGTVLAFVGQIAQRTPPNGFLPDSVVIWTGIALLFLMAWGRDRLALR